MPLIYQKIIKREDLQANPTALYAFGDNMARKGLGGQAREMRGEPNAVGIPTKRLPTMDEDAFFTINDVPSAEIKIREECQRLFNHVEKGGVVVWPLDDIGTGRAQLKYRVPLLWNLIQLLKKEIANG